MADADVVVAVRIERATSGLTRGWIAATGGQLFAELGPYQQILEAWLGQPGVHAWAAWLGPTPVAFAVLAFYQEAGRPGGPPEPVADLLGLGVLPAARQRGIGAALLERAIGAAVRAARTGPLTTLRLTVATANLEAQRLYARAGFVVEASPQPAELVYPSGVAAVRMVRPLP